MPPTSATSVYNCPACKAGPIVQKFCGNCGQERFDTQSPGIRAGIPEFIWEAYDVSVDLVKSLVSLIVPGRLTVRYLNGHTVDTVSPMKLYMISFAWVTFVVRLFLPMDAAPELDGLVTAAEISRHVLAFFLPLGMIGLLRLIWGPRRENYAFTLHSFAFLGFVALPFVNAFLLVTSIWLGITGWRTYSRIDQRTGIALAKGPLVVRLAGTIAVCYLVFLMAVFLYGLIAMLPAIATAFLRQAQVGLR